jgi:4-diphosphocytidyl-2-C-methyl-D-erythritol kinase
MLGAQMTICEIARAKINLSLTVVGRRADDYHELESLVTFADCGDRLRLSTGSDFRVTTSGPFASDITGQNLLERALALLRKIDPRLRLGRIELEKNLPVAAGLGGGSADAAALLRAVQRANPGRADALPWAETALRLGADVPMCLYGRPAFVRGIGEGLAPLPSLAAMPAVLVNPRLPLATSTVFRALAARAVPAGRPPPLPPQAFPDVDSVAAYISVHGNDLEGAAIGLLPVIAEVKSSLAALPGCRAAAMSGSGPTCFGIFANRSQARAGAVVLAARHPGYWIVQAELAGSSAGPPLSSPG